MICIKMMKPVKQNNDSLVRRQKDLTILLVNLMRNELNKIRKVLACWKAIRRGSA